MGVMLKCSSQRICLSSEAEPWAIEKGDVVRMEIKPRERRVWCFLRRVGDLFPFVRLDLLLLRGVMNLMSGGTRSGVGG